MGDISFRIVPSTASPNTLVIDALVLSICFLLQRTTQALMGAELEPAEMDPPQAPLLRGFPNGWVPLPLEEMRPERHSWYGTECCARWPRENEVAINCFCGHRVHEGCLTSLLRAYRHDACPVCVNATTPTLRLSMY